MYTFHRFNMPDFWISFFNGGYIFLVTKWTNKFYLLFLLERSQGDMQQGFSKMVCIENKMYFTLKNKCGLLAMINNIDLYTICKVLIVSTSMCSQPLLNAFGKLHMIFNSSNIFCPIPVSLYALQFCKLASLKQRMYYEYVFLMCSMHIYSHSSYTLIYKENGSNFHSCIPAKSTNRYPCQPHIFIKL